MVSFAFAMMEIIENKNIKSCLKTNLQPFDSLLTLSEIHRVLKYGFAMFLPWHLLGKFKIALIQGNFHDSGNSAKQLALLRSHLSEQPNTSYLKWRFQFYIIILIHLKYFKHFISSEKFYLQYTPFDSSLCEQQNNFYVKRGFQF